MPNIKIETAAGRRAVRSGLAAIGAIIVLGAAFTVWASLRAGEEVAVYRGAANANVTAEHAAEEFTAMRVHARDYADAIAAGDPVRSQEELGSLRLLRSSVFQSLDNLLSTGAQPIRPEVISDIKQRLNRYESLTQDNRESAPERNLLARTLTSDLNKVSLKFGTIRDSVGPELQARLDLMSTTAICVAIVALALGGLYSATLLSMLNRLGTERAKAEEASNAKSRFLATMSHEIRTPMNGVLGMLEVLTRADLGPAERQHARDARDAAERLLAILNDILDFSKIEAGQMEFESISFGPSQVLDDAISSMQTLAGNKGLALNVEIAENVPEWIEGDPTRLRQVISNLISNAIKFTSAGSVTMKMALYSQEGRDRLRIDVRDTGIGIDELNRSRLFERFSQADNSVTRQFGGTGLGLAICRELVEKMSGQIGVESEPGKGSTFWVDIPCKLAQEPTIVAADSAAATEIAPLRILIAEDHPMNQKVLRALLAAFPLELKFVNNGALAVEALKLDQFDVILMDVNMPVMSGPDATRAIRALDGASAETPIIALTANAMSNDRQDYLDAGMSDYVSKPINVTKLLEAILRQCPYASLRGGQTAARAPGAPGDSESGANAAIEEVIAQLDAQIDAITPQRIVA